MFTSCNGFYVSALPGSNDSSSRDKPDEKYYERNYEQDMDESSQRVGSNYSQQPKNQQNYKYCPEHLSPRFAFIDTL
jgi:hypothetical protein